MGLGLRRIVLDAATSGSGAVAIGDASGTTVYVQGDGDITGGTVVIEEARTVTYARMWSTLHTVDAVELSNAVQAIHMSAPVLAIRARIADPITGGSVTVEVVAN